MKTPLIPPLPASACLGVIAPAGPPKAGVLAQVAPLLKRWGFMAKRFPGCDGPAHLGHLAASDEQRLADLHAALADPEVDALLCLRGGYGCLRIGDRVDLELVRRAAKPLIGYSDITTLHGLWARAGVPAWHAPMPASDWVRDGGWPDAEHLAAALRRGVWAGDVQHAPGPCHPLDHGGCAKGRLLGGNLSVIASGLHTPADPDWRGAVLFLEDVAEDPYRLDRYLTQLRLAGVLDAVSGFVLGGFSEADSPDAVLADALHPLGKPVLAGWPAGHIVPHWALPLGLPVQLDVAQRQLRWL
ncbi:MAG: LD-carboxypeptidase [Inhella sp.]|jgi:muramoyltetrapeptide carboxypeptidase|uniref:S66 peptidase family protein n=1 Tax=Inhella sp. TaxID=1921806 RepID=UPI0022BA9A4A|nr:LD-carboxypeptidase [Inhella sp.]MCZ8235763.1 LD-carboxypeptidase [Inhella sp.]